MSDNNLHDDLQSAYKAFHSTETALLKVQSDILAALDKKSGVFLAMIDLSAAFDTVDHSILLEFLKDTIGVDGSAWNWFESYLSGRTQHVSIDNVLSDASELLYGVPQGSVMGPFKFCVYTLPLGAIIRYHGLQYSIYADDTQVYLSFDLKDADNALQKLNACLSDIRSWMIKNKLKINDDKTEFLIIASPHSHKQLSDDHHLTVGNSSIAPSSSAKNLGVIFDDKMNMEKQVSNICKSANFQLRNIGAIRNCLNDKAASQLVHSLITSRLDYCNSLLGGISDTQIERLQRVQNNAARIVAKLKKYDHISPTLQSLHWLPVKYRIEFKTLLLTYRILNDSAPSYLKNLISPYQPSRPLRSGDKLLLSVPRSKTKSYGDRCFSFRAPKTWNDLPLEIRSSQSIDTFKSSVKTHLFRKAYM